MKVEGGISVMMTGKDDIVTTEDICVKWLAR